MAKQYQSTTRIRILSSLSALSIGLLISGASFAGSDSVKLSYNTADLSSAAGTEAVYKQLARSIKLYCANDGVRSVRQRLQERECVQTMLDSAIRKIDSPKLSSLHHGSDKRKAVVAP